MSTLRANTLKPITSGNSLVLQGDSGGSGVSGPSIDSNGDVDFSQNTNAKIKLPSAGGIYESDGSTEILTESGGVVSLKNTTIDQTSMNSGMIVNSGFKFHTSGTHTSNVSTGEAVFTYNQISCSIGNTINFGCNFRADTGATATTTARYGKVYLFHSTSSVSEGATSSLGTQLNEYLVGRSLHEASSFGADSHNNINIVGGFVATATTHYLGLVFNGISSSTDITIYMTSSIPLYFYYYESKGDVLT